MNLKHLIRRQTVNDIARCYGRLVSLYPSSFQRDFSSSIAGVPSSSHVANGHERSFLEGVRYRKPVLSVDRYIHSTRQTRLRQESVQLDMESEEEEEDGTMNDFLSRFVWIMRGKISETYPDCDKQMVDGMLLVIVEKVVSEMEKGGLEHMLGASVATSSQDFSEDLWRTVWEVSNSVLEDMEKERKKEKMKQFLQCGEVTEMCRFAGEIGIRGDMLRELRFKWASEKMEESEFYERLERLRKEERDQEKEEAEAKNTETMVEQAGVAEEKPQVVSLPKRHGKIQYKIYGLDLSDPTWKEVADKIHETGGEIIWPQEPKHISGKCKLVTEKILQLGEKGDPYALLGEWVELLQPSRIDWINLLEKLKDRNSGLYLKVAEMLLDEMTFQPNIRDCSKLLDAHAKENRIQDAERILKKMTDNGILPDILMASVLIHMYSKAGNLECAKETFETLRSQGFLPDMKIYNSMIMAYVNAGQPKLGESLMREMEARDIKPTREIYMALLQSFSQLSDIAGADRIANTMQFAGLEQSFESCTLLVKAFAQAGEPDQARAQFDYMIRIGHKPDDKSTASMIRAYEKKNLLDKALNLLLHLQKNGFEPGPATYSVLVDWLGKLKLVEEAEHLLGKIAVQGEAPPFKIQASLCDMYARAGVEKKALQALGVLEAKKEQLGADDFERIINGLIAGGYVQEAHRIHGLMEAQGFAASEPLKVALMVQLYGRKRHPIL